MIRTAEGGIPTFRSQIISSPAQNTQPIDPNFGRRESNGAQKRVQLLINLQAERKPV